MKRKQRKLKLAKETLRDLNGSLRNVGGGLQDSEHGEGCGWTAGGTCGEWTCLGATCDYLCC